MAGEAERDEAMAAAEANAYARWKEHARSCLHWLNTTHDRWTTDDFWLSMREHYPDVTTHEPRALGPLLSAMIRRGEVVNYGRTTSQRPEAHKAVLFSYGRPRPDAEITRLELLLRDLTREDRASLRSLAEALYQRGMRTS